MCKQTIAMSITETIMFAYKSCTESYGDSYADSDTCRRPLALSLRPKSFAVRPKAKINDRLLLSSSSCKSLKLALVWYLYRQAFLSNKTSRHFLE
jgi:hypothetical protein